jgi:NADPH:quinone reductase-like Zn-dependent oxidoreductase
VLRGLEPQGIDVVIDGMLRLETIAGGLALLRKGGRLVGFGEPASLPELGRILAKVLAVNLFSREKSIQLYGTSFYFLGFRKPFLQDWATLFQLLAERKIEPLITQRFPLLEAAQANALMESGGVCGNVVLQTPDWTALVP